MARFLAFDLEAVLDAEAGRSHFGFTGTDREVREAMRRRKLADSNGKSDMPAPGFWQIVALGMVGIDTAKGKTHVEAWTGLEEAATLGRFNSWLSLTGAPQIVSWNGNGYDLAVLRYRSLKHGTDLSVLYGTADQRNEQRYLYRFSERHVDLMDALAGYGASPQMKLAEVAGLCGLPSKTAGSGKDVEALAGAQDWPTLNRYVLEDALVTALVFLRWQLTRGRIDRDEFNAALDLLGPEVGEVLPDLAKAMGTWRREHLQLVEATA